MAETFAHIKGFDALAKTLQELPAKMEARILRGATRAAAKVIEAEVDKRVPRGKTGHLAASVRISTRVRNGVAMASVKAGNKDAFYAHMVEGGTRRHIISAAGKVIGQAGRRKGRSIGISTLNRHLRIGVQYIGSFVWHPGAKANPFMENSLKATFQPAVDAARAYVAKRLDQLVK